MRIFVASKTKDEEKLGGPYKWIKELIKGFRREKNLEINHFRSNWKSLFNGKIIKGFKEIHKNDLVHVYVSNLSILCLTLYGKLLGRKIIYTCHGNFFEEWKKTKNYWLFLKYYLLSKLATKITYPSEYMMKKMQKKLKKGGEVAYNSFEIKEKKEKKEKRKNYTFLEVTSFDYYNKGEGVIHLAKAFNKFNKIYPNSKLLIIGGGKHFEEIKGKSNFKNITFLGTKPRNEVYDYMRSCNCFVHITKLDNIPITIVEAAKFNKPIIASDKFGIPEISKDIRLTKNTIKDILKNLLEVYELDERKTEHAQIKKFDKDKTKNQFIKVYKKTLKN
jgi:glycosyltransferase involved in cell wall biosynthesis